MRITYDPAKRLDTLAMRGLDFANAETVFTGTTFEFEDVRKDYGEHRRVCIGFLNDRMVMLGYVQRGADRHVFSMRKCNDREIRRYQTYFA